MSKKTIKESPDVSHIREFIAHVCNKDFARANASLNLAVKEKIKTVIRKDLKESN